MRLLFQSPPFLLLSFFFFNDTATTEIYTLSLHDALPISWRDRGHQTRSTTARLRARRPTRRDRKSTRLNSSHLGISYAVFCLKKKICLLSPKAFSLIGVPSLRLRHMAIFS